MALEASRFLGIEHWAPASEREQIQFVSQLLYVDAKFSISKFEDRIVLDFQ